MDRQACRGPKASPPTRQSNAPLLLDRYRHAWIFFDDDDHDHDDVLNLKQYPTERISSHHEPFQIEDGYAICS
jgi:hypothetical protein